MAKKKTKKASDSKHAAGEYTLRRDRTQEFRRTIHYEKGHSATLVFQPDKDIELTQEEVDFLENEINVGMIVPTNRDEKGRQRVVREPTAEAYATVEKLEKELEEARAEILQLKAEAANQ